jgi:hypothetical protein
MSLRIVVGGRLDPKTVPVVVGELVRSQFFVKSIVVSEFVCGHQVPSKDHLGPTYLHIS